MGFEPREQQDIYESLRDRLTGRITSLTNFTDTSFNWVWTQGFSSELREQELDATAAYLSGLIEYAGGPVDEQDLDELGISDVATPEELNERLDDQALDELVKIVGVSRDTGSEAKGTVTFTTQDSETTIPAGTSVGTTPDNSGDFFEYVTDSQVETEDGETIVDATVTAVEVGDEYNVGSGSITYLPDPPSGVQSVTNAVATSGGEDVESNNALRERAQRAIFSTSGGGTVEGVKGFVRSEVEGVDEIEIIEFFEGDSWHGTYPHAHVIVSGGDEADLLDAIDSSRPVAVQHVLVRPDSFSVRVDATLEGSGIDTGLVEDNIQEYLDELGLDDSVIDTKIIQIIMNSDDDIIDIETLSLFIEDEPQFFDPAQDVYELFGADIMQNDGVQEVTGTVDGDSHTFVENDDYVEWNTTAGDESTPHDSIQWRPNDIAAVADDGGTQTTETTAANEYTADDMTLLPSSVASGDAYYFGNSEQPFGSIEVDVSTAGDGDWTVVWEYYDGASWVGLTNVTDGTNAFKNVDRNPVTWDVPGDWSTTSVNGISGTYWVRARVDSVTTTNTQPLGQIADLFRTPDIQYDQSETLQFDADKDEYIVDDAMITDGVTEITGTLNGSSHTFVEDTDFEETDVRTDGIINGIDWSIGGDSPDDNTDFTVTYDAGTTFRTTYTLQDGVDIDFDEGSQAITGTVNISVL